MVQIGVLGSMIYGRASILRTGQEVMLEVRPVDPRDLLRGDYVWLSYNASRVPAEMIENAPEDYATHETVFVRLRPGEDGIAQPVAARIGSPPEGDKEAKDVDLRGLAATRSSFGGFLSVDYGIERFYLPEGEGKPIEENLRERSFRMKIAVAKDGAAQIKAFYDGDELVYAEPIY
jgi:uncharacterized membrane-anchored protein